MGKKSKKNKGLSLSQKQKKNDQINNNNDEKTQSKEMIESAAAAAAALDHSNDEKQQVTKVSSPGDDDSSSSSSSSSSDEEDEDLILEGVIVRNPDVSDSDDTNSSDSSDDDDDDDDVDDKGEALEDEVGEEDTKPPPTKKTKPSNNENNKKSGISGKKSKELQSENKNIATKKTSQNQTKKNKKKKKKGGPDIVQVEFTFCDMDEKYFHGLKTILASTSPIYAAHSSALADLMIENITVGTVISTPQGDEEDAVFGFASVLNVTTYQTHACIQTLKQLCLDHCPKDRKSELTTVLSGTTKRPAGFLLHGRMINIPLEIVEVLHQQLVLDMDWAVENADGGEEERKSLNFGAFVRIAPSYRSSEDGGTVYYKYFDDEIFAQHAEFIYQVQLNKTYGMEETPYCMVIVMTKTGHRAAMKALSQLVNGGPNNA